MSTGDLHNNLERLRSDLKRASFRGPLDVQGLSSGEPAAFLALLHFALLDSSRLVAKQLSDNGYDLYSKNDRRFAEGVCRVMRHEFSYRVSLSVKQLLSRGYAERKLIFVSDVVKLCRRRHEELHRQLQQLAKAKWRPLSADLAAGASHDVAVAVAVDRHRSDDDSGDDSGDDRRPVRAVTVDGSDLAPVPCGGHSSPERVALAVPSPQRPAAGPGSSSSGPPAADADPDLWAQRRGGSPPGGGGLRSPPSVALARKLPGGSPPRVGRTSSTSSNGSSSSGDAPPPPPAPATPERERERGRGRSRSPQTRRPRPRSRSPQASRRPSPPSGAMADAMGELFQPMLDQLAQQITARVDAMGAALGAQMAALEARVQLLEAGMAARGRYASRRPRSPSPPPTRAPGSPGAPPPSTNGVAAPGPVPAPAPAPAPVPGPAPVVGARNQYLDHDVVAKVQSGLRASLSVLDSSSGTFE